MEQIVELAKVLNSIKNNGPKRVMINEYEATSYERAEEKDIFPDIIFVRKDGWSLGAPTKFRSQAFGIWADEWIGFMLVADYVYKDIRQY